MIKQKPLAITFILFIFLTTIVGSVHLKATASTTVYVDPPSTIAQMEATFSVNVSVAQVTDLCSWQVFIYLKKDILDAIAYTEGPFLKSHGSTLFDGSFDNNYNDTHGELWMYCLRTWTGTGVDGSGTLGTATFQAKITGNTPLNLANTILGNSTAQRISHTTTNGAVKVIAKPHADFTWSPSSPQTGEAVNFDASTSTPNGGNIASYTWDFGDDTPEVTDTEPTIIHTYTTYGTFNVTLNVTDSEGLWDTKSKIITVARVPIAITEISPFKTIVCQGYTITINVTTQNEGTTPQTFNLTTYYNTTKIETKTITQNGHSNLTTTFTWNTTDLTEYDNYTISAHADYDTLIDGTILIVHTGDVSPVDMKVRVDDILAIAIIFGTTYPEPEYDAILDINCDLKIRVDDLLAAALNFGWTKP